MWATIYKSSERDSVPLAKLSPTVRTLTSFNGYESDKGDDPEGVHEVDRTV